MPKKLTQREVIAERSPVTGVWLCAAIVDGVRIHARYFGHYTKREVVRLFVAEVNHAN